MISLICLWWNSGKGSNNSEKNLLHDSGRNGLILKHHQQSLSAEIYRMARFVLPGLFRPRIASKR
jgi:hypothetical protein